MDKVWILTQHGKVMGVYASEGVAAIDFDRLGGKDAGYAYEGWRIDHEPVASRE